MPEICDNLPHFDEIYYRASLVVQSVKNLPTVWGTRVQSLGREDPLEKGMATHSSIPAWRIPWTEEPGGISKKSDMIERLTLWIQCPSKMQRPFMFKKGEILEMLDLSKVAAVLLLNRGKIFHKVMKVVKDAGGI